VTVAFIVLGYETLKEIAQVEYDVGIGVLLNYERTRCVLEE
jgi:hypothetical protein